MRQVHPPLKCSRSKANLDSSAGLSQSDGASGGLCGSDSDSSDSIFFTQKCVPEAERSRKKVHRKTPRSSEDLDVASSFYGSPTKSATDNEKKRLTTNLPTYSFYLHPVKSSRTTLNTRQNINMHYAVLGGFFTCVKELGESYDRGRDLLSSLPTIDQDGDFIAPLSEDDETLEDETVENEDISVVANTHFVVSKTKSRRPPDDPKRRDHQEKPQSHGGVGELQGGSDNIQTTICSSSADEDSSLVVKDKRPVSSMPVLDKTKLSTVQEKEVEMCTDSDATVSDLNPQEYTAKVVGASTAETEQQADVSQTKTQSRSEEGEPGGETLLQRDSDNGSISSEGRKKKKWEGGYCGSAVEGKPQVELEEDNNAFSETVGVRHKKETLNLSQTISEAESLSQDDGEKEADNSKRKKKRRKSRSAAENTGREMDGAVESDARVEVDSVISGTCIDMAGDKKKKKNKKRERNEDEEQLKSGEASESVVFQGTSDSGSVEEQKKKTSLSNDGEDCDILNTSNGVISQDVGSQISVKKKKKKRKTNEDGEALRSIEASDSLKDIEIPKKRKRRKESNMTSDQVDGSRDCLENTEVSLGTSDSGLVKERKNKKKHQSSSNDGEDCDIVSISNGVVTQELSPQVKTIKKKKKKRKRNEDEDHLKPSEESDCLKDDVEMRKSSKESGKESNVTSVQAEESRDCVGNTDVSLGTSDSVSRKEKKKKKKHQSSSNDREDCVILNVSNGAISQALSPQLTVKKKKKKRQNNEDEEQLKSDQAAESPKDDDDIQKSQNEGSRKSCKTSELVEEPTDCSENTKTSPGTLESESVKIKKKKKKHQCSSNDGEDCVLVSVSNGVISQKVSQVLSVKKKKKKSTSENVNMRHTLEEDDSAEKATGGTENQDTQLPTKLKKKKKKVSEESIRDIFTDPVAQSDDSASTRKKKKSSSSLDPDAVETAKPSVLCPGDPRKESAEISESLSGGDKVRKKKRKVDAVVEEMDAEEPKKTEYPQNNEDKSVKKKRRKDIEYEKSATLPKEKGLTVVENVEHTLTSPQKHQNQASNGASDRKKKKKSTHSIEADGMEVGFSIGSPSLLEMSSHSVKKSKQSKAKKKLFNPTEEFLTLS